MIGGKPVYINGDGETSRDFCYVANAVQANLLAAAGENPDAVNQVYNVAVGERISLNRLFELIQQGLARRLPTVSLLRPTYREFRSGDVRHSQADISKACQLLGYAPTHDVAAGLREAIDWYLESGPA